MRGSVVSAVAALAAVLVGCGGGTTSPPPVPVFTTLQVTPDTATLIGAPGTTTQLTATPLDQNGSAMSGLGAATWSSDDAAHATVNSSGLVTSVAVGGPVTITGSLTASGVTKTGTSKVTVTALSSTAAVTAEAALAFSPATVNITAGGTVTWTFQSVAHTVTFDAVAGAPANIGTASSPVASQAVSRMFPTAGTFTYHCLIHSQMTGTVVVH